MLGAGIFHRHGEQLMGLCESVIMEINHPVRALESAAQALVPAAI